MASPELRKLWALHDIDSQILSLKQRAAHLNVGAAEMAKLKQLEERDASEGAKARTEVAEQLDTELKQKGLDEKLHKFERQLFGGTVVNVREVEAIEKEIAMLKRQKDAIEMRLLEMMDSVPIAKATLASLGDQIAAAKKAVSEVKQAAIAERKQIEGAYLAAVAKRSEAAKAISAGLLAKYEALLKRAGGVGAAEVVKGRSCGACGTLLPERTLHAALEGSVVTCETCHRILYYTSGVA